MAFYCANGTARERVSVLEPLVGMQALSVNQSSAVSLKSSVAFDNKHVKSNLGWKWMRRILLEPFKAG